MALLAEIAELRDTPPLGEVETFLVPRAGAIDYYTPKPAVNGAELPRPRRNLRQDVYRLLGLIPERADVQQEDVAYLGSLITGFYEPTLDAFYLVDDLGGPTSSQSKATVVHELTHALQDQYYDLNALDRATNGDWDRARALSSVLEGDAMMVEAHFFGRPLRAMPPCFTLPDAVGSTAYAVQRDLDSWYFDGYCFVQAVLQVQPGGIRAVFEDLPQSTEQLLHPEKYLARERPRLVELPALAGKLGPGWQEVGGNKLGEFQIQNLLRLGAKDARLVQEGAAGWGGDHFRLYAGPEDALLLHASIVWDSAEEAAEFWGVLAGSLVARAQEIDAGDDRLTATVEGTHWRAGLTGDLVQLVVGKGALAFDSVAFAALGLP